MVEVVRLVEVTPTVTPSPTLTPTPLALESSGEVAALAAAPVDVSAAAAPVVEAQVDNGAVAVASEAVSDGGCPAYSNNQYTSIPVPGPPLTHPDSQHGDLNLALRGYVPTDAPLSLVDINGPTDGDAPQLAGVLGRLTSFGGAYQARDWNWACGDLGCRGDVLSSVPVSLIAMDSTPGEPVHVPSRGAEIYGGGYVAMVLYADTSQLTVAYMREDSVANGYVVHLEEYCVDPNLLALYQSNNGAGRGSLPAVTNGEVVGTARYNRIVVGVRDRGSFADPRSRKDWWRGY
jgi:hypothetical protein